MEDYLFRPFIVSEMEFISEPITPVEGTLDMQMMARGEPGLPKRFVWRDREYTIGQILEIRKELGGCSHGGSDQYIRKHWFTILTTDGITMKIYFERNPKPGRTSKPRWWLHSLSENGRWFMVDG